MRSSFRILSTGICLPEQRLSNTDIKDTLNNAIDPEWVEQKLGICERRIAAHDVYTSDLAAAAVCDALNNAGASAQSVDLMILATASPDRQAPATACHTQYKAGIHNAVAFDISAVCCGFLFALTTAAAALSSGQARRAIVVGADRFTHITDWQRRDCVFFGDGAGAVLLESVNTRFTRDSFFDAELFTDGQKTEAFVIEKNASHFQMDGSAVFEAASEAVPQCIRNLLQRNDMTSDDVDIVIPHQPSQSLLREIAWQSGIPFQKFQTNMDRYANTAGATIPIVLHETLTSGRIHSGDTLLFAAAGAGFTAGAALHQWH